MANLSTKYLGLELKNPLIVGSSSLTESVESIKKLEQFGAGAVVLKSLFEEQITMDIDAQRVNNMYNSFSETENYVSFYTKKHSLDKYLKLISDAKKETSIPIIASINCITAEEWISFAKKIQEAGADAIELNMFILPADIEKTGEEIEQVYFDILKAVQEQTNLPLSMKVSPYFSGLANFMKRLSEKGLQGLVLFNRFYSPDIDINTRKINSANIYSLPEDNARVLRWLAILSSRISSDFAASTGIHTGKAVIKNLLAGANATQVVSALYNNGYEYLGAMLRSIESWMKEQEIENLSEIIGSLNQYSANKPALYERSQFMRYFSDAK